MVITWFSGLDIWFSIAIVFFANLHYQPLRFPFCFINVLTEFLGNDLLLTWGTIFIDEHLPSLFYLHRSPSYYCVVIIYGKGKCPQSLPLSTYSMGNDGVSLILWIIIQRQEVSPSAIYRSATNLKAILKKNHFKS